MVRVAMFDVPVPPVKPTLVMAMAALRVGAVHRLSVCLFVCLSGVETQNAKRDFLKK